ncbi:MAG: DUF521 domain-containing protein [Acidimicrobiales bacterium]|nr:DUF521 domain-containing protein [Acidimicrobiales bacterium]
MITLSQDEERWLSGAAGRAMQLAMRLMLSAAEATNATEFVPIEFAHINSSFYSGEISLAFVDFLLAEGGHLAVPTHTNASLISCTTPELRPLDRTPAEVAGAERLMQRYEELGCTPMWSCAPYLQPEGRPSLGQHVIGSESNAVSFFNSVLGARTNKYGDFLDVCGAMIGRVPHSGLHTDEGRLARHVFRVDEAVINAYSARSDTLAHVLGIILGSRSGALVPVIDGLPAATEDELKAIAAAGASSGAVELFHIVGITPEAPTLADALGGRTPAFETLVDLSLVNSTLASLSTTTEGDVSAVCLGTPHFSIAEFIDLLSCLDGRSVSDQTVLFVTTSRAVLTELELRRLTGPLLAAGIQIVLDTCTYYTPKPSGLGELVMTNSAKWAYYAPGILGVDVVFGGLSDCVEAAVSGHVR